MSTFEGEHTGKGLFITITFVSVTRVISKLADGTDVHPRELVTVKL